MAKSRVTVEHQTAVAQEDREKLWKAFLKRRGTIRIGAGSTVADVREARSRRGGTRPGPASTIR
jgi:hypothetical protein